MAARQAFNQKIGHCALCLTSHEKILPPSAFGMRRYNKAATFHTDHIIPISKGGDNAEANRRYLCWFCNSARLDMDAKCDAAIAAAGRAFWAIVL